MVFRRYEARGDRPLFSGRETEREPWALNTEGVLTVSPTERRL